MQQVGADLHADLAGDDRHRRQQRQVAVRQFHGFERDAGQADVEQAPGQFRFRGQVQVAEQQVVLAQQRQVAGDRLLHLHDQLALLVQRGGVGRDLHPELGVLLVLEAGLHARVLLDPHLVPALDEVAGGGRHQRDAPFEGLGFLGYADAHGLFLGCCGWATALRPSRLVPRRSRLQAMHRTRNACSAKL